MGVLADNIELNITESHTKTADGVEQLHQAKEHQSKARGKVLFSVLGIFYVVAVV